MPYFFFSHPFLGFFLNKFFVLGPSNFRSTLKINEKNTLYRSKTSNYLELRPNPIIVFFKEL
jgi:hypothetical protein